MHKAMWAIHWSHGTHANLHSHFIFNMRSLKEKLECHNCMIVLMAFPLKEDCEKLSSHYFLVFCFLNYYISSIMLPKL